MFLVNYTNVDKADGRYTFLTKEDAVNQAKKKTAGDRDGDEYSVWQLVGTAKSPVPTDVPFVEVKTN